MKSRVYGYLLITLTFLMLIGPGFAWAQGASTLLQDELLGIKDETRWHGSLGFSSYKNQDEYSDAFMNTSFQLSYELSAQTSFYAETAYLRPYSSVEEDVRRYGFDDINIGFNRSLFAREFTNGVSSSVSGFVDGTIPTSDASRRASLQGAAAAGVITNHVWKRMIFSTNHSFTQNFYRYETVDAFGSAYNSPHMVVNGASATWRVTNKLNWTNALGLSYLRNFAGSEIYVQSFASSASFIVDRNFTISAFYQWRDRIITDNALFDDDTTYAGAGIRYVF